MPILTALDEYDSAITTFAMQAEFALASSGSAQLEAALRRILALCRQTDETVEDVLTYAVDGCDSIPTAYRLVS